MRVLEKTGGRFVLKRAGDAKKDQSYFLFSLSQEQLSSVIFPLGGITKEKARGIAKEAGLRTHDKQASQDICFLGGADYREFLRSRLGKKAFRAGRNKGRERQNPGQA